MLGDVASVGLMQPQRVVCLPLLRKRFNLFMRMGIETLRSQGMTAVEPTFLVPLKVCSYLMIGKRTDRPKKTILR